MICSDYSDTVANSSHRLGHVAQVIPHDCNTLRFEQRESVIAMRNRRSFAVGEKGVRGNNFRAGMRPIESTLARFALHGDDSNSLLR